MSRRFRTSYWASNACAAAWRLTEPVSNTGRCLNRYRATCRVWTRSHWISLPDRLAPWIDDIATRLQCPPDYPAITAMTALGAILGRKIAIKPQMKTDWIEIPNIWGAFIGPPGMLKSPAMNEALRPIHRLEAEAVRNNEIAQQAYAAGLDAFRLRKQVATALAKEELKKTLKGDTHSRSIDLELGEQPQAPTPMRYRTNDTSYEALAELIANNPTGI